MKREEHERGRVGITDSSGNIFVDLDLPSSPKDLLKVEIARAITKTLDRKGLTQTAAAKILGVSQARVSNVTRGRLSDFSAETLVSFLVLLGRDVDIRISDRIKKQPGRIKIIAA